MLRSRKILVHPALLRAISEAQDQMERAMRATFDAWMLEVVELRKELAEAKAELDTLRALTSGETARPPEVTLH
jgi:hypothetical protein